MSSRSCLEVYMISVFLQRTVSATWVFLPFKRTELLVMLHFHKELCVEMIIPAMRQQLTVLKFNYWYKISVYIKLFQEYCDLFQSVKKKSVVPVNPENKLLPENVCNK